MNEYLRFIEELLKDFRLSTYTLETRYNLKGFSAKYSGLRSGRTKSLNQATLASLEQALNIKIDDSDPKQITYLRLQPSQKNESAKGSTEFSGATSVYPYPLLGTVYAGEPKDLYHSSYDKVANFTYSKKGHHCFALEVDGKSMESTLKDGSTVLVDMEAPLEKDCIVAVKLKNGTQYIKRYEDVNYAFIRLKSDNGDYGERFIDKNDIEAMYRVVEAIVKLI
jgi:phage repressor protein C with HTH and peptisase S24 domain